MANLKVDMIQSGFYVMLLDTSTQTWGVVWTLNRNGVVSNHCEKFDSFSAAIKRYPYAQRLGR